MSAVWLLLWLVPVAALLIGLGEANVFSQIALFFSKMAMVTFGGAYAVLAYVAQQAVEHYHWLQPREMLDGLGMAETTPGPLIMVLQFVGFMAAYPRSRHAVADAGGHARRIAGDLGHLHALLPLDLPRRALHRDAARQQGARGRADGDHRGRGRRDPQSVDLVRAAYAVPADHAGALLGLSFDMPVLVEPRYRRRCVLAVAAATAIFRLNIGMLLGAGGVVRGGRGCCGWRDWFK